MRNVRASGDLSSQRRGHEHEGRVTGEVDATVPLADAAGVDDAVEHAHAAFDGWRRTAPTRRLELLLKLAELMEQHGDEIVRVGTAENGRPARSGSGLAALAAESYIQTKDLTRANRIAAELEAGEVLINGARTWPCTDPSAGSASAAWARRAAAPRVKSVAIAIR
ncbi:aldehyde dehydrogenase family protein [Kribbella qitaiheensis]|uniref:aldehyde dehydrogenase family protein n=1 Tax=Kribbella qitaiheensis TaxID=1544730 RepID=UPI00360BE7A2